MKKTLDIKKEYEKLAYIFYAISEADFAYLEKWNADFPVDIDECCKKLNNTANKMIKYAENNELDDDSSAIMDIFIMKTIRWMELLSEQGVELAEKWRKRNDELIWEYSRYMYYLSEKPPFHMDFWQNLAYTLDGGSGLLINADYDLIDEILVTNEYLYKDWFFAFEYREPSTLLAYFIVDTDDEKDNKSIMAKIHQYLIQKRKAGKTRLINGIFEGKGQALELTIPRFLLQEPEGHEKILNKVEAFVNIIEDAVRQLDFSLLNKPQIRPYLELTPRGYKQIMCENDWGHDLISRVYRLDGIFVIKSDIKLRKATLFADELVIADGDIIDAKLDSQYKEIWFFPDNEYGEKAEAIYGEDRDNEALEAFLNPSYQARLITIGGELRIRFLGYQKKGRAKPKVGNKRKRFLPARGFEAGQRVELQ